jgi:hypothetical protein
MRPKVYSAYSPQQGRWVWWVQWGAPLPTFFWTWGAALDFAIERALYLRHKNHVHLWV